MIDPSMEIMQQSVPKMEQDLNDLLGFLIGIPVECDRFRRIAMIVQSMAAADPTRSLVIGSLAVNRLVELMQEGDSGELSES